MKQLPKQCAFVVSITFALSAIALLFAQGRIFANALSDSPLDKPVSDACYIASLPGVILATAIWGYNSNRTILSDIFIIAINGLLYAIPIVVLIRMASIIGGRKKTRES